MWTYGTRSHEELLTWVNPAYQLLFFKVSKTQPRSLVRIVLINGKNSRTHWWWSFSNDEDLVVKPESVKQLTPLFPSLPAKLNQHCCIVTCQWVIFIDRDNKECPFWTCLHNPASPQRTLMLRSTSGLNKVRNKVKTIANTTKTNETKTTMKTTHEYKV